MKEIDASLIETFQKSDLMDLVQEYTEIGLDSITSNPAFEKIPLVGTIVSLAKAGIGIREVFFVKKLIKFLSESQMDDSEREAFAQKVGEIKEEKIGERVIFALDKVEDELKAVYIGRLFKAYALGGISSDSLKRGIRAIEMAYISDLKLVTKSPHELQYIEPSISDGLYSIGLLEIGIQVNDHESHALPANHRKYKPSSLGALIANCVFQANSSYLPESGRGFMNTHITPYYRKPKPYMGN